MLRPLISILLVLALGALLAQRLWDLPSSVAELRQAAAASGVPLEDGALFAAAQAAGLVETAADDRLLLAPEDLFLARRAAALAAGREPQRDPVAEDLLGRLYETPAGAEVRGQIRLWNRTRVVAAVRDNAEYLGAEIDPPWAAEDCRGGGRAIARGGLPADFGYVHEGQLKPGFGAWNTASVPDDGCVVFVGGFIADERPREAMTIQVVGTGDLDLRYCPPRKVKGEEPSCDAGAWTIPPRDWTCAEDGCRLELRREVHAATHRSSVVGGVKLRRTADGSIQWFDDSNPIRRRSIRPLALTTLDGTALLDERGRANEAARALGLLGLVGVDYNDFNALSGRLIYGEEPLALTLTLDEAIMEAAQGALEARLDAMGLKRDRYADERRAALVILDATDGAVRAAASWPPAPQQLKISAWDRAAFSKTYPLRDPFKTSAWQMVDRHNAPGSTFKPVTALSALTAIANGHPEAEALTELLEGLPPSAYAKRTGISGSRHNYNPYWGTGLLGRRGIPSRTVANFGNGTVQRVLGRRERDGVCADEVPITRTLSLISAVRDSINVWFDGLAMQVDGDAALAFDRDPSQETPRLWLMRRIDTLGLRDAMDLLPGRPAGTATIRATPGNASLFVDKPWPMAWTLVQNAIGQGVQITPLHLAGVAASIASGRLIHPHLDAAWNGRPFVPDPPELGLDLTLLRAGMKAVPEVGTAAGAFRASPERCRLYGKTGTATIGRLTGGNEDYNSAWFMGWLDDDEGTPRYAFACMVSHSPRTGGATCAPVVAELLNRIRAKPGS